MKKLKMKVGDFAIVIDLLKGHCFKSGEIVEITELCPEGDNPHYRCSNSNTFWYLIPEELEQIKL